MKQAETVLEEARMSTLPDPNSLEHLMTHLPKHPDCRAGQIAKMKASHCRRVPHEHKEKVTKFGQEVTADTLVAKNAVSKSCEGSKSAIVWSARREPQHIGRTKGISSVCRTESTNRFVL